MRPLRFVAALIVGAAAPAAAQSTDAFAGLPDTTFTFYAIEGGDAAAIRAAMNAARPTDRNDGARVDAGTRWSMRWRWRRSGRRGCDLAGARVTTSAEVTLPRLAHPDALPSELLARWKRYLAALEAHEAGHVRYVYQHRGDVLAAIRGATCATAAAAAKRALDAIKMHDRAYDRDTRHGESQGAVFP